MTVFASNSACIAAYLELFQALSEPEQDTDACVRRWADLQAEEAGTPQELVLSTRFLRERFNLSQRDFLLIMSALALEMDGAMRGAFRTRYGLRLPTFEYGLQLIEPICPSTVETLAELAGNDLLTGLLLIATEHSPYPLERPLILCRSILACLTGLSFASIPGVTILTETDGSWQMPLYEDMLQEIQAWHKSGGRSSLCICGPDGSGRRTLLRRACSGAVCVDLSVLAHLSALEQEQAFRDAVVTAVLMSVPVCAVHVSGHGEVRKSLECLCRHYSVPLAVLVEMEADLDGNSEVVYLPHQLTVSERQAAWRFFLPQSDPESCPDGAMTIGSVAETAALALRYAESCQRDVVLPEDTRKAQRVRGGAMEFSIRYDISVSLADMVLPETVMEQIRLICQTAQCGNVLAAWDLPQIREGVAAVFHGPSGTGKTMAASAIAGTLGLPLLRADLSRIMDKYVGETEKHLAKLLQSARENRCVLLFDEADALFGKRAEVSTGHDKYANLSTSYLLQEIERYEGVVLLSTNLLSNFDEAFLRRLHYIVRFPMPDTAAREELWRRALPAERLEGDIPYAALAKAELTPARINAAVRSAAVTALAAGKEQVDTDGLLHALRLEMGKDGKTPPPGLV